MSQQLEVQQTAPWWVPYAFIAFLVLASFAFVMQGKMGPAEFLAFAAALGFRAPPASQTRGSDS